MTGDKLIQICKFAKAEMTKTYDPQHDFGHVERVRKNALKIAKILKVHRKIDLNLLQAICLLHDLTYARHKPNFINFYLEGRFMRKIGAEVFEEFKINNRERKFMMEAFLGHTHWFIFRGLFKTKINSNIYTKILYDADKIDIFSNDRWVSLLSARRKYLFYRLSWPVIYSFVRLGKNNTGVFLNYPQVAKDFRKN